MVKINTCIFISGKGTNLKKLILNANGYNFPIKIKFVVGVMSQRDAELQSIQLLGNPCA